MTEESQSKSWWKRNWKWAVPTGGCLTLIVVFVVTIFIGVKSLFSGSTPYKMAFEKANNNELVIEAIGEPIETDGMMNGNISLTNDDGEINMSVPIKGPKGGGKLTIIGIKTDGKWQYDEMSIKIENNEQTINLLEDKH